MKLDGAIIAIEPRSVGACLDLACLFYRAHARQIIGLTVLFALPWCLLAYWAAAISDLGLFWGMMSFFVGSPLLGAALVAGAGYRVFGDPFTIRSTLRILMSHLILLAFALGAARVVIGLFWLPLAASLLIQSGDVAASVAMALCGIVSAVPGALLATRYGFLPEVILLEQSRGLGFERRIAELMRNTFMTLLSRGLTIAGFFGCIVPSLFILLDLACGTMLGLPIFFGRATGGFWVEQIGNLLLFDPAVVTALCGTMWLVYPLTRLAWFFCYLDVRIRKECWDVELDFRIEMRRLESASRVETE